MTKGLFTAVVFLCGVLSCEAVIALNAPTGDFVAVPLGGESDPFVDEQSQGKGLDLVGGVGGFNAFYVAFNTGTSSTTDGEFVFRTRLGGSKKGTFEAFLDIGLDIDGGGLDYVIQFSGKNPNTIRLLRASGTTANNTTLGSEVFSNLAQDVDYGTNALFTEVSNIVDIAPEAGFTGDVTDIDDNDGEDYFLTFSFNFNHLVQAVRADAALTAGDPNKLDDSFQLFDDSFSFAMLVTTSQNANNINGDFGGIDGNEAGSGDVPYVGPDPGPGLSNPYLPEEENFVPEPSVSGFMLGFMALVLVFFRRNRA